MVGMCVVNVRGYQIIRERDRDKESAIVESWVRHFRLALFALSGDVRSGGRNDPQGGEGGDSAESNSAGRLGEQLLNSLCAAISDFEVGTAGGTLAESEPTAKSRSPSFSMLPPILTALARSMDMQTLAGAAVWLAKEHGRARDINKDRQCENQSAMEGAGEPQRSDQEIEHAKHSRSVLVRNREGALQEIDRARTRSARGTEVPKDKETKESMARSLSPEKGKAKEKERRKSKEVDVGKEIERKKIHGESEQEGREEGGEKIESGGGKGTDRGAKRLRTRASSGTSKAADFNENVNSKEINETLEKEESMPEASIVCNNNVKRKDFRKDEAKATEENCSSPPALKRPCWGVSVGGCVSTHIAVCLQKRMAIRTSVAPICQKLLEFFEFPSSHDSGNLGNRTSGVTANECSDAGEHKHYKEEKRNKKEIGKDKKTDTAKEDGDTEELVRTSLRDVEAKAAALQEQLAVQLDRIDKQRKAVRRIQIKQDLDIARASQHDSRAQTPQGSTERDANEMMSSLERSLPLISSLRAYAEPAALGLRLHTAKSLCHAANEARVLVAMLLSEQGQVRLRLDTLRDNASTVAAAAAQAAHAAQTSRADSTATAEIATSKDAATGEESAIHQTVSCLSRSSSTAAMPAESAKDSAVLAIQATTVTSESGSFENDTCRQDATSNPHDIRVMGLRQVNETQAAIQQQLQQEEAQLESNVGLVLEMTVAGATFSPFFFMCKMSFVGGCIVSVLNMSSSGTCCADHLVLVKGTVACEIYRSYFGKLTRGVSQHDGF